MNNWFDLSDRGIGRVILFTVLGTGCCVAVALGYDSYSFETGEWALKDRWMNNIVIPLLLAPAFFAFLLAKLRELALAHHDLLQIASTDVLTACLNRRAFVATVDGYMERMRRDAPPTGALLILDIDHFKGVNDRFGHATGDAALITVANTIRMNVRDTDLVGRLGGEEFGVFLPGLNPAMSLVVAERLREAVSKLDFCPNGEACELTVNVGGTTFEQPVPFKGLFRQADERLYRAKWAGRNRVDLARFRASAQQATVH